MNPYFAEDVELFRKSRISLEGTIQELTSKQEEVHDQVYKQISELVDGPFERRRVYHNPAINTLESSFPYMPIILLRTYTVEESPIEPEYLLFLAMNHEQEPTRREFFHLILSHGYAHQLWDELYADSIKDICHASAEGDPMKVYQAAGEAFAFWLSEQLNGFNHISEDLANEYDDVADVRALKFIYTKLTQESDQKSPKSIVQRLSTIMQNYISNIEDVGLPPNLLAAYFKQQRRH